MADFDANAYKIVDVSPFASLIKGGAETFPRRSENARRIVRAEDFTYLAEGLARREAMLERREFVRSSTVGKDAPIQKVADITSIDSLIRSVFKHRRITTFSDPFAGYPLTSGFLLRDDWSSYLTNLPYTGSLSTIATRLNLLMKYDSNPPSISNPQIIRTEALQDQYRKMNEAKAIFVPFSPAFVVPESTSRYQYFRRAWLSSGELIDESENVVTASIAVGEMSVRPYHQSYASAELRYSVYKTSSSSFPKYIFQDPMTAALTTGSEKLVFLYRMRGYDGLGNRIAPTGQSFQYGLFTSSDFYADMLSDMVYMGGNLARRLNLTQQNITASSVVDTYKNLIFSKGSQFADLDVGIYCLGRIYETAAEQKAWHWPGLT